MLGANPPALFGGPNKRITGGILIFFRQMGAAQPKAARDAHSAAGPVSTSRRRRDHAGLGDSNSLKLSSSLLTRSAA